MRPRDVENIADFLKYYTNSWVGWRQEDGTISPCVVGSSGSTATASLKSMTKKDNSFNIGSWNTYTLKDLDDNVDFGTPIMGMTPDGPTTVFLSNSTPRVGQKGLRIQNSQVTQFNESNLKGYRTPRNRDKYDWIYFSFNPIYKEPDLAYAELTDGTNVGVALSQRVALYTDPAFKYPIVAYKRWIVGYMPTRKDLVINTKYNEYVEEIRKVMNI